MSVAVIIVSYNSASLLERCLQSLSDQTIQADKVIVVDNASTEAATHVLLDEITHAEVIRLDTNLGYGGAINHAARQLEDMEFICCLNPDAFPESDWLAQLLLSAETHPRHGSFASLMLKDIDPDIIDGAGDVMHISGVPWRRFHGRRLSDQKLKRETVFSACAGAALYRLDTFMKVSGFDPTFFMYVEDIDLGFRLNRIGAPCLFVPEAVVRHGGSAITGYRSDFSIYYGHRNLIWSYFKNMPTTLLVLTLPLHLFVNLVIIFVYALRGKGGTICRAKWHGLLGLKQMIAKRGGQRIGDTLPLLSWFR